MKTKFIVLGLLVVAVSLGLIHANYTTTSSAYVTHMQSSLNFQASYENGKVTMNRGKFDVPYGHSWQYWKVVRSSKNSNPVYPDDGYIYYGGNLSDSAYVDSNPPAGTNYYRVCAITSAESKHRYCSNVKEIYVNGATTSTPPTSQSTTYTSTLNARKKGLIDTMAAGFMDRLRAKYSNDEDIAAKLGTTITALNTIKSARLQAVFGYLIEILQDEKDMLELGLLLQVD